MVKNIFVFSILFIILLSEAKSQIEFQRNSLDLIPPSPNSSELIKIIDTPIDEFTGQVQSIIPVYTIEDKDLKVPVKLVYNSNGIKVDQISSCVGLGWSLEAGGVVTRIVRGNPDDQYDNSIPSSYGLFYYSDKVNIMNGTDIRDKIDYSVSFGSGGLDNEPDIFYFSLPGYSGRFFFDSDRNIHFSPKQNVKIVEHYQSGSELISAFTITTPDGNEYYFASIERTETNLPNDNLFHSSWYLTKIFTSHNTTVDFYYNDEDILEKTASGELQVYYKNQWKKWSKTVIPEIRYHNKRLQKIIWTGGEVNFKPSTFVRSDVSRHSDDNHAARVLSQIEIKDKFGDFVKAFKLSYDYFDNSGGISNDVYLYKRLKLTTVTEVGLGGISGGEYNFSYNNYSLPPRNSKERDFWGFFNDNGASTLIPNLYFYASSNLNNFYPSQYSIIRRYNSGSTEYAINVGANRNINSTALQAGILKEITYPTGGRLRFTYEPNTFRFENRNVNGGGLRVSKIEHLDGNVVKRTINYDYSNPTTGNSSGLILNLPVFAFQRTARGTAISNQTDLYNKTFFSANSMTDLNFFNGSNVVYEYVRKKETGNGSVLKKFDVPEIQPNQVVLNFNGSNSLTLKRSFPVNYGARYIEYEYGSMGPHHMHYFGNIQVKDLFPYVPVANLIWSMGQVLEESIYGEGNPSTPLKKFEYKYDILDVDSVRAFKMGFSDMDVQGRLSFFHAGQYISNMVLSYYNRSDYLTISAIKRLAEKKEITNSGTNTLSKTTEYLYNSRNFLSRVTTYDSNEINLQTRYTYPFNYTWDGNYSYSSSALIFKTMVDKYIINQPIEITNIRNGKIVSSDLFTYKVENNIVVPNIHYILEIDAPMAISFPGLSYSSLSMSSNMVRFDKSRSYKLAEQFNTHDNKGNLIQVINRDGITTSYLWSYDHTLPIAKLTGAKFSSTAALSEAAYIGFESNEKSNNNPDNDYWSIDRSNQSFTTDAKVGKYAWYMTSTYGPTRTVKPASQSCKYTFSGWAKTPSSYSGSCYFVLCANDANGNVLPNGYKTVSIGNTGGIWKYFEVTLDLSNVTSTISTVGAYPWKASGSALYVDELRLRPTDSLIETYSYWPLVGIRSQTDENGITTSYFYDALGRLHFTTNDDSDIMSRYKYNYKQ